MLRRCPAVAPPPSLRGARAAPRRSPAARATTPGPDGAGPAAPAPTPTARRATGRWSRCSSRARAEQPGPWPSTCSRARPATRRSSLAVGRARRAADRRCRRSPCPFETVVTAVEGEGDDASRRPRRPTPSPRSTRPASAPADVRERARRPAQPGRHGVDPGRAPRRHDRGGDQRRRRGRGRSTPSCATWCPCCPPRRSAPARAGRRPRWSTSTAPWSTRWRRTRWSR